jgi:hypothetical protein
MQRIIKYFPRRVLNAAPLHLFDNPSKSKWWQKEKQGSKK